MKSLRLIVALILFASGGVCQVPTRAPASTNEVTFREPFTLTLHLDKEHYYEETFPKIPYVHQNDVYLFAGEAFGIDLQITNKLIQSISYQADSEKASVGLRFKQETGDDGGAMMMLVIKNQTDQKLYLDAVMTVPGKKGIRETSILPVGPHLSGYESWPHPIVQLVLRNIRLQEKASSDNAANGSPPTVPQTNQTSSTTGFTPPTK